MRKGFSLIELLTVVGVISILSVPLARLSTATIRDIPENLRIIESNTSILNMLQQLRRDTNIAKSFPTSVEGYTANDETLLIKLANETICYQLKDGRVFRRTLANSQTGSEENITRWPVRQAKIKWSVWRKGPASYAVEAKTCIERKRGDVVEKKMANSHLYFTGAYQEAVN